MPARRWPFYALLGWTVFVWAGRIRNGGSFVLAASFLVLAGVALWRHGRWITALAAYTVVVWVIRTPIILVRDYSVGFKVVHTVLAAVSIALAIVAYRGVQREREVVG